MPAAGPLTLTLELQRPSELLPRFYPNGRFGGLTVDGAPPAPLGQECKLKVRIARPSVRVFELRGQLAWARHKASKTLKECFGVDFLDSDDPGRDRLLRYAREEVPDSATRFEERLSTHLAVKLKYGGKTRREELADLSQGGAFVKTSTPLPVGTLLECDLRPPHALLAIKLPSRVAWVRARGANAGMGLEFLYDNLRQSERVRHLLDTLASRQEP